jgi:hypothetical protein
VGLTRLQYWPQLASLTCSILRGAYACSSRITLPLSALLLHVLLCCVCRSLAGSKALQDSCTPPCCFVHMARQATQ